MGAKGFVAGPFLNVNYREPPRELVAEATIGRYRQPTGGVELGADGASVGGRRPHAIDGGTEAQLSPGQPTAGEAAKATAVGDHQGSRRSRGRRRLSQSPNRTSARTMAPPFDWYWTSTARNRPTARETSSADNLCPPPRGSAVRAERSLADAAAVARRTAPGRAVSTLGMRRSAAAPPVADSVPARQSTVTPACVSSSPPSSPRAEAAGPAVTNRPRQARRQAAPAPATYSHSMVAGGFEEMS